MPDQSVPQYGVPFEYAGLRFVYRKREYFGHLCYTMDDSERWRGCFVIEMMPHYKYTEYFYEVLRWMKILWGTTV